MSRRCEISQKKPLVGHNVSHSNRKTKMRQLPNLRTKRVFDETAGRWIKIRVSTSGLRTLTKIGLKKALKKAQASAV
jgi:large subunit ribosomal protein L28